MGELHTVRIDVHEGYDVRVGAGVLGGGGEVVRSIGAKRVLLVADAGLPGDVAEHVSERIDGAGIEVARCVIEPSEAAKSIETLARVLTAAADARLDRRDAILALGGGIVGDVAGFAAASYRRGIAVVQCPTTVLSMVDASVGGKTGVNLRTAGGLRKNLVGAFWQPRAVLADVGVLASLPQRIARAGLAECVKHALIWRSVGAADEGDQLAWIEERSAELLACEPGVMADLVARNVRIKAAAVTADEREMAASSVGGRALLNLGHTFAHAIEPLGQLSPTGKAEDAPLQHGEAVALGVIAACRLGTELGLMERSTGERVEGVIGRLGLPTRVSGLPGSEELIDAMMDDKKVLSGVLRVIVPESRDGGLGSARVVDDPPPEAVRAAWESLRAD